MISENKTVISTLKLLGFTSSEISVYEVLIENDFLIVNEISKLANVPRTKTYDILHKLELKNVIQRQEGHPIKYRAKDPIQTLKSMRKNIIDESEQGLALLQESWESRESIDDLKPISVYYGSANYYKIFKKLEKDVKLNLFIILPYLVSVEEIDIIKNIIKSNLKKGIKTELVLHPDISKTVDKDTLNFFKENTTFKIAPVPIRVIFIDNLEITLQIPSSESSEDISPEDIHDVVIRLPDLVQTVEKSIRASINQVAGNY